ncbi:winged helix-turn-helix domain-containing protein [Pseudoalteromonas sp. M8]|uniref:winged helix-turn-helix domain-containing protein n=1 Tax=Pseudoalteromonas sp. M8 TaxID=2692624 RepID=UPI001BAC2C33|nr:winged helix-turn-helix domain-containing protein [Pseudoalteromonas sp. M8]QUI71522.1 tetratricopeptide repeat protein [Pseudoalteromonas sp. M8]
MKNLLLGNWLVVPKLNQIVEYPTGREYTVTPKVMKLLLVLVDAKPEPLSIENLVELVWHPKVVSDNSVYQAVAQLRKILNTDPQYEEYIERISAQGYRIHPNIALREHKAAVMPVSKKRIWLLGVTITLLALIAFFAFYIQTDQKHKTQNNPYFDEITLATHLSQSTAVEELARAKTIYQQVLSKQSDNVEALSGLCNVFMGLSVYGAVSEYESLALCRPLLEKARILDDTNIEVITSLARFAVMENEIEQAQNYFKRGFELSTKHARLWHWYGRFLRDQHKISDAIAAHKQAYQLAPNDAVIIRGLAYAYLNFRELVLARKYFDRSVAVAPHTKNNPLYALDFYPLNQNRASQYLLWYRNNHISHSKLYPAQQLSHILVLLSLGRAEEAEEKYQQAANLGSISTAFRLYVESGIAWRQGDFEKAEELLKQRYELDSKGNHYVMPYILALLAQQRIQPALTLFEQHFADIAALKLPEAGNVGQYLTYALMLKRTGEQSKLKRVTQLLAQYLNQGNQLDAALSPYWFALNNDVAETKQALTQLLNTGWLPDYNDSFFATDLYLALTSDHEFKQAWLNKLESRQNEL